MKEKHPYELLLAMEEIEHRTTKIHSPRTNGFVERMNRTLLEECFKVEGRMTWYIEPGEIQRDLDKFLEYNNLKRSHQGYRLKSGTPAQAFKEALAGRPCRESSQRRRWRIKALRDMVSRKGPVSGNYDHCTLIGDSYLKLVSS